MKVYPITAKEHPIIFTAPMVRANREGRKTVTRRLTGWNSVNQCPDTWINRGWLPDHPGCVCFVSTKPVWRPVRSPYGVPGDKLWVREGWAADFGQDRRRARDIAPTRKLWWRADKRHAISEDHRGRWRSPLHLPRLFARDVYTVKSIEPVRLWDIDDAEARLEGFGSRAEFVEYWNSLGKDRDFDAANWWVWRVEYET